MATYLQTKAIVLGHRDLAEHDRLYTLLTERRGKLEVRVRGARKTLSKLQPPLSSIAVTRVLIYEGRSRPLLIGVETAERFPALHTSLWRTRYAARFLRLVDLTTRAEAVDREIFELTIESLRSAETAAPAHAPSLRDAFILKLLSHAGYRPELDHCVICRSRTVSAVSAAHGGAICEQCVSKDTSAVPADELVFDALRAHAALPLAATPMFFGNDLAAYTAPLLRYRLETPLWFPAAV
jgi:DNA repair protein RecO (recombination protein O)